MGTIKKGILGGFSGKIGTVVGANWKGVSYMRSLPKKFRDPHTEPQLNQRSKLAISIFFLKPVAELLRIGWKLYAQQRSTFNAAMSYTMLNAITGTYPNYSIDSGKVLISRGSLPPAVNAGATSVSGKMKFEWNNNSGSSAAKQTDKALLAVVNPAKSEAVFDAAGADRKSGKQTLVLPADWSGNNVEAYLGFISDDGKEVANSMYLGSITVA